MFPAIPAAKPSDTRRVQVARGQTSETMGFDAEINGNEGFDEETLGG